MELFHSASILGDAFRDANVYLVLLAALVLIYIGDMAGSRAVMAIIASVVLLYYPFHEFYIYTVYGEETCDIMAGFMALPIVIAYTIFRVAERQAELHKVPDDADIRPGLKGILERLERHLGSRYVWLAVALGLFLVFLACSMDSLSLEQFKF